MGSEFASGKLEDERMGGESVPGRGNSSSERGRHVPGADGGRVTGLQ